MHILLLGPIVRNRLHGAEPCIFNALNELGHKVWAYDYRDNKYVMPNGNILNDGLTILEKQYDVILCPGAGLPSSIYEANWWNEIKGVKTLWNSEPIRLESYYNKMKGNIGKFDLYCTFDESEIPIYKELGIDACWLPQAYGPSQYFSMNIEPNKDIAAIMHIGGKWINRSHLLKRVSKNFRVSYGTVMNAAEVNKAYNEHKLVLNLGLYCQESGRPEDLRAFGWQQRVFQSIGVGRVCITNEIPKNTNRLFEHKTNILLYNKDNLEEIIEYGLNDKNRRRMEANVAKIAPLHTYKARMEKLLDIVEN